MRHLNDEDLDVLTIWLESRIIAQLSRMETRIMATLQEVAAVDADLQDELNQIIAKDAEQDALIAQLQGQIGSGNLPPEQQAAVDNLFTQLSAQRDQVKVALASSPGTAPAVLAENVVIDAQNAKVAEANAGVPDSAEKARIEAENAAIDAENARIDAENQAAILAAEAQ